MTLTLSDRDRAALRKVARAGGQAGKGKAKSHGPAIKAYWASERAAHRRAKNGVQPTVKQPESEPEPK